LKQQQRTPTTATPHHSPPTANPPRAHTPRPLRVACCDKKTESCAAAVVRGLSCPSGQRSIESAASPSTYPSCHEKVCEVTSGTTLFKPANDQKRCCVSDKVLASATPKYAGYRGKKATTSSGKTCQSWASHAHHAHHHLTDATKQYEGLGDHTYCRNPDGELQGPWCYTTDPSTRYATRRTTGVVHMVRWGAGVVRTARVRV